MGDAQLGCNLIDRIIRIELDCEIPKAIWRGRHVLVSSSVHVSSSTYDAIAAVTFLDEVQTDWKHRSAVSFVPVHNSRAVVVEKLLSTAALFGKGALRVDDKIPPPATAVVELVFTCCSRGASTQFPEAVSLEVEIVSSSTPIKNRRRLSVFQRLEPSCESRHDGKPAQQVRVPKRQPIRPQKHEFQREMRRHQWKAKIRVEVDQDGPRLHRRWA